MMQFRSIRTRAGICATAWVLVALGAAGPAAAPSPAAAAQRPRHGGAHAAPTTQEAPPQASPGYEWPTYNNQLDGERFSSLKEITPENASHLGEACRIQVDGLTTFESGIIVVNGTLYASTGTETFALDAGTCAVRWHDSYTPEDKFTPTSRGVAVMDGRVFRGTGDGRLLALDAATGKLLWKDVIGAPRLGENVAGAPLAWNGVVYIGIAGSELGVRGRVMAFDAQTGRELWRFYTIPRGDQKGADTWKRPETAKTGGGGVWGAMSLDVTTAELFVPVGNPWPDIDKDYRPGDNLFTDSVVVLDARTGALKWWHQVARNDWQDLDMVAPPVLYRDTTSGVHDIVAFGGKDGYVTAVDRDSHDVLFRTPVTTIGPSFPGATPAGVDACPGYAGGVEWNGPALDPPDHTLIAGSVDICFVVKLGSTKYSATEPNYGGSVQPDTVMTGWVTAMDSATGEVRWKYHTEKPVVAAVTPTAGGVTFAGDLAGNFYVFNSKTGEVLRKLPTGGALAGGIVTYELHGRQYVAFASGNVSRLAFGALGLPSVVVMTLDPGHERRLAIAGSTLPVNLKGGAPDPVNGRRIYGRICAACHGPDGDLVAAHHLSTLSQRMDHAATVAFIKNPKAPMPKLYPSMLGEQSVLDVTAYLNQLQKH